MYLLKSRLLQKYLGNRRIWRGDVGGGLSAGERNCEEEDTGADHEVSPRKQSGALQG
jgi:hypothetical protein